jgi:hypothetical protein
VVRVELERRRGQERVQLLVEILQVQDVKPRVDFIYQLFIYGLKLQRVKHKFVYFM